MTQDTRNPACMEESCARDGTCGEVCPNQPAPPSLAEALHRFQSEAKPGTCDTGRYRCSYSVWGEGPPLVFIPGLSDQALSFVMIMARLSANFRCIAYDLPQGINHGAHVGPYTHTDLIADLFALLDHLDIRQTYLFGSSFGSTIALAAAHDQRERIPRFILQGGFAYRPLARAEVLLASVARYLPGPLNRLPFRRELVQRTHGAPFAACPPDVWEFFLSRWGSRPMRAVAHHALMLHRLDLRPMLSEVRQPVMLICGDDDPLVNRHCEEVLLGGLPHVTRAELQDCGHNPQYTHPEAVAELVKRFLTPARCMV